MLKNMNFKLLFDCLFIKLKHLFGVHIFRVLIIYLFAFIVYLLIIFGIKGGLMIMKKMIKKIGAWLYVNLFNIMIVLIAIEGLVLITFSASHGSNGTDPMSIGFSMFSLIFSLISLARSQKSNSKKNIEYYISHASNLNDLHKYGFISEKTLKKEKEKLVKEFNKNFDPDTLELKFSDITIKDKNIF